MLGREGRVRGFNVVLAGGVNLARDVRNGRNFEYVSEDPLLSALIAAGSIEGVQSEGVISTIKHFSLNCNETNRHWLDARIDPDARVPLDVDRLNNARLVEGRRGPLLPLASRLAYWLSLLLQAVGP